MPKLSAIALFCDDIREEVGGAHSLIGVLGDNVIVPSFPGALSKLGIYVRLNIPANFTPCPFEIFINYPNGEVIKATEISEEMVSKTIGEARESGNPIAGIYSKMIASPFPIVSSGRINVEIHYGNLKEVIGTLNFLAEEKPA